MISLKIFGSKGHPKGFNFIEMMTALGIAGVLGVTGINSYRKQRHQARAAQAQYSLSNIYAAEKNFHNQWKTYHENLYIIGAVPEGELWYDAGFPDANIIPTDVTNYPWQAQLKIPACYTFDQICKNNCATEIKKTVTTTGVTVANYGSGAFNCKVIGGNFVKGQPNTSGNQYGDGYGAGTTGFKALATSKLNKVDTWHINNKQELIHIMDGTGN